MQNQILSNKNYFLPLITALLLSWVAFYNGYPLVEGDTGSYINAPMIGQLPIDRTPFYGYFIRYSNLVTSLWYTLIVQCIVTALAIHKYIKHVWGGDVPVNIMITITFTICAFTCAPWVAAFLMPDIFSAVLFLSVLLFVQHKGSKWQGLGITLILFCLISMHNSHFLIVLIFALGLLIWSLIKKHTILVRRSIILIATALSFFLLMSNMNKNEDRGFVFSPSSHVFMMTKFAETGILKNYLDENCDKKQLKMCAYKDQIPAVSWAFLWNSNSPLYKTGGWESNNAEYKYIIHDIFSTPQYVIKFCEKSIIYTIQQFFTINTPGEMTVHPEGSSTYTGIKNYYPYELNDYVRSKQNSKSLSGESANIVYLLFFAITSIALLLLHREIITNNYKNLYILILFFLIVNAFVTSTFSTVHYRFQYRVFWIVPATNIILLTKWYYKKWLVPEQVSHE